MQNMSNQQNLNWTQAILVIVIAVLASVLGTMGAIKVAPQQMGVNQGAGIQALPQNPFTVTMNDTTANRALNTTYRNLEGTAMIVMVYVNLHVNVTGATVNARAFVNQSTPPATEMGHVSALTFTSNRTVLLMFFVPNLFYYSVNSTRTGATGSSGATIIKWYESIPPTSFGLSIFSAIAIVREER